MATVIIDLSVSLDGYIAGPDDGDGLPLGVGGQALFTWMGAGTEPMGEDGFLSPAEASRPVVAEWTTGSGAMISGRRTFDIANGWADGHPVDAPIFVVTHEPPTEGRWSPRVTFVPEGVETALARARQVAGDGTISASGASVAQQLLQLGAVDEIQLSVTPVLLGGGVRLLDHIGEAPVTLEQTRVIASEGVTHLRYRVVRRGYSAAG
jgi:dihydrofolate reductase